MAIETIHLAVRRRLPAIIVPVHNMAGIAEARLLRYHDHPGCENSRGNDYQQYLRFQVQLFELIYWK